MPITINADGRTLQLPSILNPSPGRESSCFVYNNINAGWYIALQCDEMNALALLQNGWVGFPRGSRRIPGVLDLATRMPRVRVAPPEQDTAVDAFIPATEELRVAMMDYLLGMQFPEVDPVALVREGIIRRRVGSPLMYVTPARRITFRSTNARPLPLP